MNQERGSYLYRNGSSIQIGDRVICTVDHPDDNPDIICGSLGTVVVFDEEFYRHIGVEWDNEIKDGHSLRSSGVHAKDGHGWWMKEQEIEYAMCEYPEEDFEPAEPAAVFAMLGMK